MWSRRLAPSAVVAAAARRLTSTHSMHTFAPAAVPHAHVHGASCSHDHAAAVPSSSASLSGSSASRPQPPVLAKGQMPPGDHPHLPGWYQRPLPHTLIPFSSNKGKAVFKEAMNRGGMEGYFALAEQFQTQSTPAYCGPGTLAMVLNALALDPKRLWKGNWRWFSEEMLETCDIRKPSHEPLAGVDLHGLSFEEFLFLAECNGSNVRAFRSNESSLGKFRAAIATATTRTDLHLVASFSRKVLGQTGSGHYSPIGGYHAELDLALVLDVARFKYPPYWAPVTLLWEAVCAIDEETGRGRGYYLMSKGKLAAQVTSANDADIFTPLSSACRIAVDKESWSKLAEHFCSVMPMQLKRQYEEGRFSTQSTVSSPPSPAAGTTAALDLEVSAIFREILLSLPVELSSIFMMYTHDLNERMIAQYQLHEKEREKLAATTNSAEQEVAADPTTDAHECTATSSCRVHTSALSIYHTLLPAVTPHQHSHAIPPAHALQPLLKLIASTHMFRVLQQANIDFAALESKGHARHDNDQARAFYLLAGNVDGESELATLLLFACPEQIFSHLPDHLQAHIASLRQLSALPAALHLEVRNLRSQMGILAEFCLCGAAPSVQGNDNPNVDPSDAKANTSPQEATQTATSARASLAPPRARTPTDARSPATDDPRAAHRFVSGSRSHAGRRSNK